MKSEGQFIRKISNISLWLGAWIAIISVNPWFAWNVDLNLILVPVFIVLRLLCARIEHTAAQIISTLFFLLASIFLSQIMIATIFTSIRLFVWTLFPGILIILMDGRQKKILLRRIITIYSALIAFSLLGFILFKMGVPLPNSPIDNANPVYGSFTNYYFFTLQMDLGMFTRFSSMFIEPGHVGMISALILFITGYRLNNWKTISLTVALIWTFSLAGYALYIGGLIIRMLCTSRRPLRIIVYIALGSVILGSIAVWYANNNDDPFSTLILNRVEVDSSGKVSGNNRTTENFDAFYDQFSRNDQFLTGIGMNQMYERFYGTPNTSYKTFILENGFLSICAFILFWIIFCWCYPSKLALCFSMLLFGSFLQRPYILWPIELYTALCAIPGFMTMRRDSTWRRKARKLLLSNSGDASMAV